jgi:hypothetical protein
VLRGDEDECGVGAADDGRTVAVAARHAVADRGSDPHRAAVFVLIEAILSLVDELQGFDPAAYKVASGTDLVLRRDPALATGYRIQTAYPRP